MKILNSFFLHKEKFKDNFKLNYFNEKIFSIIVMIIIFFFELYKIFGNTIIKYK